MVGFFLCRLQIIVYGTDEKTTDQFKQVFLKYATRNYPVENQEVEY